MQTMKPILITLLLASLGSLQAAESSSKPPFGAEFPMLEVLTTGEWWILKKPAGNQPPAPSMDVPRDEVVAFALYTVHGGVMKMSAQLFPLKPGEPREARLEVKRGNAWVEIAKSPVLYPGWDAQFRIEKWDATKDAVYRVRHGETAMFEGLIRRDPVEKQEIVVASLSCNSSRTTGLRPEIVNNLKIQNPDLLFFAGDQTYRHTEHTAGWIEFGLQFRDIMRDRPTIAIPDDHDVGQGNLWGENGKRSTTPGDDDGGYRYPPAYVNQVQRQQTWNLPDPVDPSPVERGIGVYFTSYTVGGVNFAILEDRKFKSGPGGKIPQMGPRPDHINDPAYDPKTIDLPGLQLLGERQEKFLRSWAQDWTGAEMKAVLSQTAFSGAVHLHGAQRNRLFADLDSNGWPQTKRNLALEEIRRAWAVHLCGDQHLGVTVKNGINEFGDGPYSFTNPAIVNTIYGRWWHPLEEKAGPNAVPGSPLPWTGDYKDGLGNRITMLAYANPTDVRDEKQRADGYGIARFNKQKRTITFEAWPRYVDVKQGDQGQFPGWPITVAMDANDGRKVTGWLPEITFKGAKNPVVQVVEEATGDILYTVRVQGNRFQPRVYAPGKYTVRVGQGMPDAATLTGLEAAEKSRAGKKTLKL